MNAWADGHTAFTKVEVRGPDARNFLNGLIANQLPQKNGSVILTHLLNQRGRIEIERLSPVWMKIGTT